jgi:hypothetical protein
MILMLASGPGTVLIERGVITSVVRWSFHFQVVLQCIRLLIQNGYKNYCGSLLMQLTMTFVNRQPKSLTSGIFVKGWALTLTEGARLLKQLGYKWWTRFDYNTGLRTTSIRRAHAFRQLEISITGNEAWFSSRRNMEELLRRDQRQHHQPPLLTL